MGLKAAVNGRFGIAPTPWALVARAVGNECPKSVHRFGLVGMKGAVPHSSAGFRLFRSHVHPESRETVEGHDGTTPSILHRRFLLKGNKIQNVWGSFVLFTVYKALFTTNERMLPCTKEVLWMVYMRCIIVGMYYFLTLSDTFLILWDESVSLKRV